MTPLVDKAQIERIKRRFYRLYGDEAERCIERLLMMIGSYGVGLQPHEPNQLWNEKDVVLITYGDSVKNDQEAPLATLNRFCSRHLKGVINLVHILPFYPWSSDDGFSVIDYRQVDDALGDWQDVDTLSNEFDLMFDLVLNHCSSKSGWFEEYIECVLPYLDFFKESDPKKDHSEVVRPRTSDLLTEFETRDGPKHVWTTFSADQVDLNWENPDVFFEFLDILFFYVSHKARIVRLDAIAFIWKTIGTSCIHLPETHEIVKLYRDILEMVAPQLILLTETNVPHEENISYFGNGDEAHMVYQFSLPPLLLHGLLSENSQYLTDWAKSLPDLPDKCTYFNFTSSHDGVGVRPLQGLLPDDEFDKLIKAVDERKGHVSYKANSDGSKSPYELNITYFEALSVPDDLNDPLGIARFLTSQYVAASLQGVPAVYIHSITASPNDHEGVISSGINRRINRRKWDENTIEALIKDESTPQSQVFKTYSRVLRRRANYPAFHPDADQQIVELGNDFFGVIRTTPDMGQRIACLSNFTASRQTITNISKYLNVPEFNSLRDIISGKNIAVEADALEFAPYQTIWFVAS